ncbi:MAG: hypothetical protein LBE20_07125 [Deltaproteobacteria bacterium]|jgi:hypothetical protein|nr:hypothetical protein [Deltaproteobacteria bacterium]
MSIEKNYQLHKYLEIIWTIFKSGARKGYFICGLLIAFTLLLVALYYIEFFSAFVPYGNNLLGVVLFFLGLPFSVIIRLDNLSEWLEINEPTLILILACVITCINISLILGLREFYLRLVKK